MITILESLSFHCKPPFLFQRHNIYDPLRDRNIGLAEYRSMMNNMGFVALLFGDPDILVAEVNRLAQKLLLHHDVEMDHIGCFLGDMDWLDYPSWRLPCRICSAPTVVTRNHLDQEKENCLMNAVSELEDIVLRSRNRCFQRLESSQTFVVTLPLAYLDDECQRPIDKIFTDTPGHTINDVLSTFQEHRHFIVMSYSYFDQTWDARTINLDGDSFSYKSDRVDEGWRTRGEWKRQRIAVMSEHLSQTLKHGPLDLYT